MAYLATCSKKGCEIFRECDFREPKLVAHATGAARAAAAALGAGVVAGAAVGRGAVVAAAKRWGGRLVVDWAG